MHIKKKIRLYVGKENWLPCYFWCLSIFSKDIRIALVEFNSKYPTPGSVPGYGIRDFVILWRQVLRMCKKINVTIYGNVFPCGACTYHDGWNRKKSLFETRTYPATVVGLSQKANRLLKMLRATQPNLNTILNLIWL